MKHYHPPLPNNLPDLPLGCNEIQATVKPGSETRLEDYIDQLPGLDRERFNRLSNIACQAKGGGYGNTGPGATVLALNDLVRSHGDATVGLHPRVTHVVPLGALDPLLDAVVDLLDGDSSLNAYQHPASLLECRGAAPDVQALYPPEYHIRTADIARALRANDLLTSVRRPDQPYPDVEELRAAVEAMDEDGERVDRTVTLLQPDGELEPNLYIGGFSLGDAPPSKDEVSDLCKYLFHRHGMILDIRDYKDKPRA